MTPEQARQKAENRAKKANVTVTEEQVREEIVNWIMYKTCNNMSEVEELINENKEAAEELGNRGAELVRSEYNFRFGEVPAKGSAGYEEEAYDEVRITSGYGIQVLKDPNLTAGVWQILKKEGTLWITGNRPVLKSNGIDITGKSGEMRLSIPRAAEQYFEVTDWKVENSEAATKSAHTVGRRSFSDTDDFHTIVLKKIDAAETI